MSKIVRRYVMLVFVILIPLLVAFLVGSYGYNSEKFGQGQWKDEFYQDFFKKAPDTTREKIESFMEYGILPRYVSYDLTPVFDQEIKSESGIKYFDMLIYRAVVDYEDEEDAIFEYYFFLYNVQYQNIRDSYPADATLKKEINKAEVPSLVITRYALPENTARDITMIPREYALPFPDYNSDVTTISGKKADVDDIEEGEPFVQVYQGVSQMTDIYDVKNYNIKIRTEYANIKDDENNKITNVLASFDLELETNPRNIDFSDYHESFMRDLNKLGYFGWAFKTYLWWISLIGFVAVGLVTGSFYIVFVSEEKKLIEEAKKNKKKRK